MKKYLFLIKKISHPAENNVMKKIKYKKEAPLCTRVKASYMVEAAVVLPVFATFLLFLLFFFRTLQVQQVIGSALINSSRRLAIMSAAKGGKQNDKSNMAVNLLSAEILFRSELKGEESLYFISNGLNGVYLINSDFKGDYVTLRADYKMKMPIGILSKSKVTIHQCAKTRKWTGQSEENESISLDETVYITKNGVVYHKTRECTYLKPSTKKIIRSSIESSRNESGAKYYPCLKCVKNEKPLSYVYITDYGNRYHNALTCSELEKMVYMVKLSKVKDKRACSKCGKE